MYKKYIKRILDIILSLIAIIITLPIFLIVGILVLIFLGKPAIFRQKRPGKNEKIFTMYKFRTMTNKKDENGNLLPDELRLTKLGKFLRKTSLDEIPEFINILKGDMSFVGPRPLLVEYLPYYTEEEHHRHDVRPGLTGLAQVSGRNLLNWDERFKKDIEYVNNITFLNDSKIIIKTIKKVLFNEDLTVCTTTGLKFKSLDKERNKHEMIFLKLTKSIYEQSYKDILKCLKELPTVKDNRAAELTSNIKEYLNNNTAIIYVCLIDKKVVGIIWGYEIEKNIIHINYFVVDNDYRNKQIGTNLLKIMLDANKNKKIELLVNKNNIKAIMFYDKFDFSKEKYNGEKYKMTRCV